MFMRVNMHVSERPSIRIHLQIYIQVRLVPTGNQGPLSPPLCWGCGGSRGFVFRGNDMCSSSMGPGSGIRQTSGRFANSCRMRMFKRMTLDVYTDLPRFCIDVHVMCNCYTVSTISLLYHCGLLEELSSALLYWRRTCLPGVGNR